LPPKHLAGGKKPAKEYTGDQCVYTTTNRGNFYTQLSSKRGKLRGLTLDLKKKGVDKDAIQKNVDIIQR